MTDPLFILCPGRSFSSVVSTVIGQHPDCYGVPELNLFMGRTVGEAWRNDMRRVMNPLQGLKRVVAELHFGAQTDATVEEAIAWIEARFDWSGPRMLRHLQEVVAPRILVEKSPANVIHPKVVAAIARAFPEAHYLQLLRHPRPRGKSQVKNWEIQNRRKMGLLGAGTPPDAEEKWTGTHLVLRELAESLAPGQMMWIRGEDLMRELTFYLPQICEWLGIRTDAEALAPMLHPEESPFSGFGPAKARGGTNTDFLENPHLDFDRLARMPEASLDGPLDWAPDEVFSDETRRLAHEYGYR